MYVSQARCLVVAFGSSGNVVMGTADGGFTWELKLEPTVLGDLRPIQALPNGEAWVAGGGPDPENPFQIQAHFWHTTDFGDNWKCAPVSLQRRPCLQLAFLTAWLIVVGLRVCILACTPCQEVLSSTCRSQMLTPATQ